MSDITDGLMAPRCQVCGIEGARERPVPLRSVVCDTCWDEAVNFPDREPFQIGSDLSIDELLAPTPDPREGTPGTCAYCGSPGAWHRTLRGRWVLLEPGTYPTEKIPPGKRWRVACDGTAVNLGRSNPTDECRITHFDVCPGKSAPTEGTLLLALWRRHRAAVTATPAPPASSSATPSSPPRAARPARRMYVTPVSREEARSVECPSCGARPRDLCVGVRGQFRVSNHQERINAYRLQIADGNAS